MLAYTRREMVRISLKSSASLLFARTRLHASPFAQIEPPVADARAGAIRDLLAYFNEIAPRLLRPAEGVLRHPSIAPSLPGKAYSTSLWDWDTYWTARGLFRAAAMTHNRALHQQLVQHARGSLLNFLREPVGGRPHSHPDRRQECRSLRLSAQGSRAHQKPSKAGNGSTVVADCRRVEGCQLACAAL